MTKSFKCASCSAPLEFAGTTMQKCRYCGSTVIAPPELFYASTATPFGDFSSLTGKALKIAEIDQLIHEGKKIEAIKLFRETFGVGLAEAKEAVERMERGESVDISGMRVQRSRVATAADIEKVKKIGFTIGGSILATVLLSLLIIGGVTIAIIYFTWTAIDSKLPIVANSANTSSTPAASKPTPTPDAIEVMKIGGEGNGAGRFKDNRHVAVDGKGRIYSSDYSPHRIQVFDPTGNFLNQWPPESGSNLYDLVADRDGFVYIANDKGVFKHEGESGKLVAKTATNLYPRGMALMSDGKLAVTTRKGIVILDNSLQTVSEWKDAAGAANSTFGFEKIAADGAGMIYALDDHANEICKFSADGKFLDRFPTGAGSPNAIAVDPVGRIYVSDTSDIEVLDLSGQKLRSLRSNQAFGMAFNQQGELFVASRPYVLKHWLSF